MMTLDVKSSDNDCGEGHSHTLADSSSEWMQNRQKAQGEEREKKGPEEEMSEKRSWKDCVVKD